MQNILPTRPRLLSALVLLLALLVRPVLASHLLGGELTYRYLDSDGPDAAPLRYEITLTIYNNCLPAAIAPATSAQLGIYDLASGNRITMTTLNFPTIASGNVNILETSPGYFKSACISPPIPVGCNITGPTQPYILQRFVATVNLPITSQGYSVAYYQNARNGDITNISNPGGTNLGLYTTMAPPATPNRSPVFANLAVAIICANDTTYYLNNAIDADGDRLTYTFGTPYNINSVTGATFGTPPTVAYNTGGYSATTPFGVGTGIVSQLNQLTGIAALATPNTGKYVIAVDVKEYRTIAGVEKLIGTTRRDVQLVVAQCPSTPAPKVPTPAAGLARNYTVIAGSTQTIPITATQSDGHPLTLTATSELLDGPGGFDATLNNNPGTTAGITGAVTAAGPTGSVAGNFVYKSACSDVRTTPYDIVVSVKDEGCAGKTIYDVFHITVVKPTGPTAITGDAAVCASTTATSQYTASGGNATNITWTVTGGTIVSGQGTNTITVRWGAAGAGTVKAQGAAGVCLADAVTRNVNVQAIPVLAFQGSRTICPGDNTVVTVVGGGTGATYTVTGGPVSGTGTTFTLTPTATTTYTVTSTPAAGGCPTTSPLAITVSPAVVADAGPAKTTISGQPVQIGAAPVAGYSYSWVLTSSSASSVGSGLSNPAIANPTVTATNYTGAPITQVYTLTTTNQATGCSGKAQVIVTINVDTTLEIFNVVTPNGDTKNEYLFVKNVRSFPGNKMEVYNRWGRQVYSTTNYDTNSNHWGDAPDTAPGVYYYMFTQANGTTTKGWVEVVK